MLSGEGNENDEKTTIGLISKKTTLHVQHTFFVHFFAFFFARPQQETSRNFVVTRFMEPNVAPVVVQFFSLTHFYLGGR